MILEDKTCAFENIGVSLGIEHSLCQTASLQTQTLRILDRGANFSLTPSELLLAQTSKAPPNPAQGHSVRKTSRKQEKQTEGGRTDGRTGEFFEMRDP